MEKWLILICAASVIALAGCGYDLSTPEGRADAFMRCARIPADLAIQDRLNDPDSYERIGAHWFTEQGTPIPTRDFLSDDLVETSLDLLAAEDWYPRVVMVEFRVKNAFGARVTGSAVTSVDAADDCYRAVKVVSIE